MSDEPTLRDLLAFVEAEVRTPLRSLTDGLAELTRSPEATLLRQALRSTRAVGDAANLLSPEVNRAIGQLREVADRLRREGVDPALGVANLVGDCLDGLEVLVATEAVPLPAELEEVRLAIARMRRPELQLDLSLPADGARATLAGRLVRTLVEEAPELAESRTGLDELERAVAEAFAGAADRTRIGDPAQPVEVRARLRADLLTVDVVDRGGDEADAGDALAEPRWDVEFVRRAMDQVAYERGAPGARCGTLRLRKRLRSWQWRRASG